MDKINNLAKWLLITLSFMTAMAALIMVFIPGATWSAAFVISAMFGIFHRMLSFKDAIEAKWSLEDEMKKELNKPSSPSSSHDNEDEK